MKRILLFLVLGLAIISCNKDKDPDSYKIRYVVQGSDIDEIKYNANNINYSVKKNFANGWDTTFTHTNKQKLQLQAKTKSSSASSLTAIIYINDAEVAKDVDNTKDTEGKFEVKTEYQIP